MWNVDKWKKFKVIINILEVILIMIYSIGMLWGMALMAMMFLL